MKTGLVVTAMLALAALPYSANAADTDAPTCDIHFISTRSFVTDAGTIWGVNKANMARDIALEVLTQENQIRFAETVNYGTLGLKNRIMIYGYKNYRELKLIEDTVSKNYDCRIEIELLGIYVQSGGFYSPTISIHAAFKYFEGGKNILKSNKFIDPAYSLKVKSDSDSDEYRKEIGHGFVIGIQQFVDKMGKKMASKSKR
jgi:hypothetical protein